MPYNVEMDDLAITVQVGQSTCKLKRDVQQSFRHVTPSSQRPPKGAVLVYAPVANACREVFPATVGQVRKKQQLALAGTVVTSIGDHVDEAKTRDVTVTGDVKHKARLLGQIFQWVSPDFRQGRMIPVGLDQ